MMNGGGPIIYCGIHISSRIKEQANHNGIADCTMQRRRSTVSTLVNICSRSDEKGEKILQVVRLQTSPFIITPWPEAAQFVQGSQTTSWVFAFETRAKNSHTGKLVVT